MWPDIVAVVAMQPLLVSCRTDGSLVLRLLEKEKVLGVDFALPGLAEGKGSRRPKLEFGWEDCLCSVCERERRFAGGLGRSRADRPQHYWEFVDPLLAMLLEFVEAPCLEALEDLGVCSFRLAIATRVSDGGVADLRAKVGAIGIE